MAIKMSSWIFLPAKNEVAFIEFIHVKVVKMILYTLARHTKTASSIYGILRYAFKHFKINFVRLVSQ